MTPVRPSLWMVDVIKALASQLIVWHHFVSYGPMSRTLYPHAQYVFDWLHEDGRMAVQAFLVTAGFLAARTLAPGAKQLSFNPSVSVITRLAWHRYVRLIRPYLVALLLAIVLAACARWLVTDPDTPSAPSFMQVLFHVLLIHDIAGVDALSTGVWYVAIDFQLYCMVLVLLWSSRRLALTFQVPMRTVGVLLFTGLTAMSLLWFNRNQSLEEWGIYFFGAYGLGVMAQWSSEERSSYAWLATLLFICTLALVLEWRLRLIVSLVTVALLLFGAHSTYRPGRSFEQIAGWFSRISYFAFLIHYPIALLIGAFAAHFWPNNVSISAVGFMAAWLMTLGLADVLYRHIEARR